MIATLLLLALLFAALISDLRNRRIPNELVLLGLASALAVSLVPTFDAAIGKTLGIDLDVLSALGGLTVALVGMLPLYALRAMGAGDVKLMMMVGAFLGPMQTLGVVVLTFISGGVLAVVMALWQRSFRQLATNLRFMMMTSAIRTAGGQAPRFEPLAQTAGRMPYAVAIAAGTVMQLILVRAGGWALS